MRNLFFGLAMAAAIGISPAASAATIAFDDAYAANVSRPATSYQESQGVTIGGTYFATVGGIGNGDPGNWRLGGTNGSAFLGCNSGVSCSPTFSFASDVSSLSLDLGLGGNLGWTANFTVTALLDGMPVATQGLTLAAVSNPGPWGTVSFDTTLDQIRVTATYGGGAFAFGIDNVVYTNATGVPEPATLGLFGLAVLGLGAARRFKAPARRSA
jgi:hypothetical protein